MYKHILIATDGSELATRGVRHGLGLARAMELAREARGGSNNPIAEFERLASATALGILEQARKVAQEEGVKVETIHVPDARPAEGIIATAEDKKCDLVVMASHGRRGIQRLFLGSQALEVLTRSKIPALIVR